MSKRLPNDSVLVFSRLERQDKGSTIEADPEHNVLDNVHNIEHEIAQECGCEIKMVTSSRYEDLIQSASRRATGSRCVACGD